VDESLERNAGDAAMGGVDDFARNGISEGGAQEADGIGAMALNFEMNGVTSFDGVNNCSLSQDCRKETERSISNVWLQMKPKSIFIYSCSGIYIKNALESALRGFWNIVAIKFRRKLT
jgi:hypothetical protein